MNWREVVVMRQRTKIVGLVVSAVIVVIGFLFPTGNLSAVAVVTLIALIAVVTFIVFFIMLFFKDRKS